MRDGGLRQLFQKHIPAFHWVPIETWSTGQGVPDTNYCFEGTEGWIEFKQTSGWAVDVSPGQVAWHERRHRAGGRSFIAVRRQAPQGPRRGDAVDQLWLFYGHQARDLSTMGLRTSSLHFSIGIGPSKWQWPMVATCLLDRRSLADILAAT